MKHSFFKFLAIALYYGTSFSAACNNEAAKTETAGFSLDSAKAAIAASNMAFWRKLGNRRFGKVCKLLHYRRCYESTQYACHDRHCSHYRFF